MVPAVGEGFVFFEEYKGPFRVEPYDNWTFYCKRDGCPKDCQRTLGAVARNMKLFKNDLEPLAFLHAWRDVAIDPVKGHRKTPVPESAVKDFFNDHYDELAALRALFYSP